MNSSKTHAVLTPEQKATMGVYQKFDVRRTDGRDQPGQEREEAEYFVLDYRYDAHAWVAAAGYAVTVATDYPVLSIDLARRLLTVVPLMMAHGTNRARVLRIVNEAGDPARTFEESGLYKTLIDHATRVGGSAPGSGPAPGPGDATDPPAR